MKQPSIISLCLMHCVFLQMLYAQNEAQSFSTFRALLKTGERIEISRGKLTDSVLIDLSSKQGEREILLSSIRALDRNVGTQALKGTLIGTGIGLLTSILVVVQIETDPQRKLKDDAGLVFAGFTVGCGLIGFLVGSAYDEWEHVPIHTSLKAGHKDGSYQLLVKVEF